MKLIIDLGHRDNVEVTRFNKDNFDKIIKEIEDESKFLRIGVKDKTTVLISKDKIIRIYMEDEK